MGKVRDQINGISFKSEDALNKAMLGVVRRLNELTVKGLAMDPLAVDKIVREALREPWNGPMPLTKSIQELFDVRRLEMATSPVSLPRLKTILAKRDHSLLGTDARHSDVRDLVLHLCNELNTLPPLSKPVLAFLSQVNSTKALGQTTEDWTLDVWKDDFSAYNAKTPRGCDPVVRALFILHNESPSLASAARPEGLGKTELVHTVINDSLTKELCNTLPNSRGAVVACLFKGDYDGARGAVLANRNENQVGRVIPLGAPDLSELSLVPM